MFQTTDCPFAFCLCFRSLAFTRCSYYYFFVFSILFNLSLIYQIIFRCFLAIFILCIRITRVCAKMQTFEVRRSNTRSQQLKNMDLILSSLKPGDSLAVLSFMGMSCRRIPSPDPDHSFLWAGYAGYGDDDDEIQLFTLTI